MDIFYLPIVLTVGCGIFIFCLLCTIDTPKKSTKLRTEIDNIYVDTKKYDTYTEYILKNANRLCISFLYEIEMDIQDCVISIIFTNKNTNDIIKTIKINCDDKFNKYIYYCNDDIILGYSGIKPNSHYKITTVNDYNYDKLINNHCNKNKRYIYVYTQEDYIKRYIETGKSIFKIGQTDSIIKNRINDQICRTSLPYAISIITIYEVDNDITDKIIHNIISQINTNSIISKETNKKDYQFIQPGTEWIDNISISDIEIAIKAYNGKFIFINNDALLRDV